MYKLECTWYNGMRNKWQTYIVKDNDNNEIIFKSKQDAEKHISFEYLTDEPYQTEMKFKIIEL